MSTPDEASLSKTSSAQRSRWSLSNGLSSLLNPKGSHINSFSIELDDRSVIKKHGPGDNVQGKIVLDVARPLGVTHIVVSLLGYAQVYRNHSRTAANLSRPSPSRAVTGKGKRWVSEYYGDGYMSLFEEELVLCGEGRLDPKHSPFHFQFDLEFPSHLALPSNIDFDKGTITYLITSTLTRPAYTNPTLKCQAKIRFVEDIDIALLPEPKVQVVTLRPENPNTSPRTNIKRLTSHDSKRIHHASSISNTVSSNKSVQSQPDVSTPTKRTSTSVASTESSSSRERRRSTVPSEPRSSNTASSLNGKPFKSERNITVSAQLCRNGCLPGHYVPLLIKIQHNKVIGNPTGVLVTLYRQARVDMHPHLPLASSEERTNEKFEDYYPRSRTGLGGLSLSAAGSSQMWRKDMSQTTAPLYIDKYTKSQEIRVNVFVPELPEAFPSIRNVPGHMISFRYMVEAIIDIHGKMMGHNLPSGTSSTAGTPQPVYPPNDDAIPSEQTDRTNPSTWESNFVDTTRLRRDKNALTVECELIVGTRDSERKGKQRKGEPNRDTRQAFEAGKEDLPTASYGNGEEHDGLYMADDQNHSEWDTEWEPRWDEVTQRWLYVDQWGHIYDEDWNFVGYDQTFEEEQMLPGFEDVPDMIPPPSFPQHLSEKERLQQAEQMLLPSHPPGESEGEAYSQTQNDQLITAPQLDEESSPTSLAPSTLRPDMSANHVGQSSTSAVHDFAPPLSSSVATAIAQPTVPENDLDASNSAFSDAGNAGNAGNANEPPVAPTAPSAEEIEQAAQERLLGNEQNAGHEGTTWAPDDDR